MSDHPLFDAAESERRKREGMQLAEDNKKSLLTHARELARKIAESRADRSITADDVAEALSRDGISIHALGNSAGSLFRQSCWQWTGARVKSQRAHAHANELKVWRLIP